MFINLALHWALGIVWRRVPAMVGEYGAWRTRPDVSCDSYEWRNPESEAERAQIAVRTYRFPEYRWISG